MVRVLELRAVGWAHSFPVAAGARAARVWTAGHLESLDWARDAPDTVHSVLLAVSELVTNAHVHAASTAHLVLTWDGRCLHVSVADADPHLPRPRRPDGRATSGRGLAIVAALADNWDVHPGDHRKTITACFRPPGGSERRDGSERRHGPEHRHGPERRDGPP